MPQYIHSKSRCWYEAAVSEFLVSSHDKILAELTTNCDFTLLQTQRDAWITEIAILQKCLRGFSGTIALEFNIPRMGRRIDAVIITGPAVFVIEFKVGAQDTARSAYEQVWDYALDLKNFHRESHSIPIIPILIATNARSSGTVRCEPDSDKVYKPIVINVEQLPGTLQQVLLTLGGQAVAGDKWLTSPYHPTPTIIEAARALYANHSVESIARHEAGENLRTTSRRIEELVTEACASKKKIICFVTGVPGAGKTLVGLNIATHHRREEAPTHAVFLSGNGPLVAVLREALTRDEVNRRKGNGENVRKKQVAESIKLFIQNVHNFRDEGLTDTQAPPFEHVVIFDEAQRAWNRKKTTSFMRTKKKVENFNQSEPQFLISYMDRHADWAVIICLVGGGQEINTGEAGIGAWLDAVAGAFPSWEMYISSKLHDSEYAAGNALTVARQHSNTHFEDSLHLSVPMRSYRAEDVSAFVKSLLDCDRADARNLYAKFHSRYPIVVTRDIRAAKSWLRAKARGTERFGIVSSSKAQRLKPHAIDVRVGINPVHWFLNDKNDTRSSYYLEDTGTEFHVQGLELDWTCVTWDGDLRYTGEGWSYHRFRGDGWCRVKQIDAQNYLRNAYRVLLTRARQGMVIFVPNGDPTDPTRAQRFYDPVFNYLSDLGIPVVAS